MKTDIRSNLGNYDELEKIYHEDRKSFKEEFEKLMPELGQSEFARFWKARLDYNSKPALFKAFKIEEVLTVISVCLLSSFLIKIPAIFNTGVSDDMFYQKNAAIIVILGLTLYTILISRLNNTRTLIITALAFIIPAFYINLLPSDDPSDAVILAFIHLPFLMWFVYGIVYSGFDLTDLRKRMEFIKSNADLAIIFALIAIAGGILSAITIGLFDSIGMNIENFYAENIIITGAVSAPVVAAFLAGKFPNLAGRLSQIIATLFSPLVLVTLIIFLSAMLISGKDPYNDRDFLLVFNIMLLGVMGIIIFSVLGAASGRYERINTLILSGLSLIAIITDLVALSAIFYRLGEYGLTPNRLAVLVSNLLILVNLVLILTDLGRIIFKKKEHAVVENTVARFLPVYLVWIVVVVFGFPLFFS